MIMTAIKVKVTQLLKALREPTDILPLVIFRVGFGLMMFFSALRFMSKGWVQTFYLEPQFHFAYTGFEWLTPLPGNGMYLVFGLMALASLGIALGLSYHLSIISFFLLFTYVELLDKAFYLNHYYFISLLSFLLIFLPLHKSWSLDCKLKPALKVNTVPAWTIRAIQLQVSLVYIWAGIAKLKPEWLFEAMPLKIWLSAQAGLPVIGFLFEYDWTAYLMSWSGAIYDLLIPFLLLWRPTRLIAFILVVLFHGLTGWLLPIGIFPVIMIVSSLIFFDAKDYQQILHFFTRKAISRPINISKHNNKTSPIIGLVLAVFFALQLILPLRHWFYPGNVLWTEEGFRFAWHVMLAEKTGQTIFRVKDPRNARQWLVYPGDYLTPQQEKQMAFQPDMILQFAHYLEDMYRKEGFTALEIRAESYVSLNGTSSRLLISPAVDLLKEENSLVHKTWILK